jgi:hypothetical protein
MKRINRLFSKITIEHLWAITVIVGIFAFVNTHPIRPHDFWWHIAVGRDIVAEKSIPQVDIYSYTRLGQPYPSYTMFWLMDVVLFCIYRLGGPILTILVQSFLITTGYLVMLFIAYRVSRSWRTAAFGVLFAAAMGFGNWNVRPQAITYLYGGLIFLGITEFRLTQKRLWLGLLPLVMVFWVNSHGSFPIGLAIIGCWLADGSWNILVSKIRRKTWDFKPLLPGLIGIGMAALACLLNPRGLGIITYLGGMSENTTVQNNILEWMPPTLSSLEGGIFFLGLLLLAVLLAVSPKRPNFFEIVTFLLFGILAIKYIRGVVWFGLILSPVVAVHLAALLAQLGWGKPSSSQTASMRRLNVIFLGGLMFLAFISLPWFKHLFPFVPAKQGLISVETPIQATEYMIENKLPAQVFHDMAFGSYLIWAAQPEYKVFVDSRIELFPEDIWDDYWSITTAGSNWQELLDKYSIHTLMLEPVKQIDLIEAADASSAWRRVYEDSAAILFVRK